MLNLKQTAILALALGTTISFASFATAQTTPAPGHESHAGHDHGDHSPMDDADVETFPGSFAEIEGDHVIGSASAPETMIIYASVMCPHCAQWFDTVWPEIKKDYVETGNLRVVFREFPTAPAQLSFAGFLIANCGPDDQYFANIEHQMAEQANLLKAAQAGVGKEAYLEVALKGGLKDEDEMNTCLSDEDGMARIQNAMKLAKSARVNSVPNFIIGGELFKGKSELEPLRAHLDELADKGFTPLPR